MKILQLCKKYPYPVKDGESLAIVSMAKALADLGCEVTMLAMNTLRHFSEAANEHSTELAFYKSIHTVEIDNRIKPLDAFLNLFSSQSYHIQRFVCPQFKETLQSLLKKEHFDVIQLETVYLAPYISTIRANSKAIIAMRAHNVEHEIWERIASNTDNPIKRWYLDHLTQKLKRYEVQVINDYDLMVAITNRDLRTFQWLGYQKASVVIPIGIDSDQYEPDEASFHKPLSLSFIGSLDWRPNIEGLQWFLDEVWPAVEAKLPDLSLHVAGRNTPTSLKQQANDRLIIHGEVASAKAFINQHCLMVVPILSGSGMRAKILEGMALGKVVLTTTMGLEGIAAENRKHLLIADQPEEIVNAIIYCLENPARFAEMGRAARAFIEENFDSKAITRKLTQQYTTLQSINV